MKKKGFTLIELLAVIVILAIIALIAVPIVLNIINNSKDSARIRSAEMYVDAVQQTITRKNLSSAYNPTSCSVQLNGNLLCVGDINELEIEVDGEKPTGGAIQLTDGKITGIQLYYGKTIIVQNSDGDIIQHDPTIQPTEPGLYDSNNLLLATFDELINDYGLDIESDYTSSTYKTGNSMYYILNNNSSLSNGAKIIFDESVEKIGAYAFYGCKKITSVTIGEGVTSIGDSAFWNCSGLVSVTIPGTVKSIGAQSFALCTNLLTVELPEGVETIGNQAFAWCANLTRITIPSTVTKIDGIPYSLCPKLESVIVAENNTKYDSRDNSNAIIETATNTLMVGSNNTVIPSTVTSIGTSAFWGSGIVDLEIPDNVTSIGEQAFSNALELTAIKLSNNITIIPESAFLSCKKLTSVTIPNSITSIESFAFSSCTSLISVEIPNKVQSIEQQAFYGCTNLATVYFNQTTVPTFGPSSFIKYSGVQTTFYFKNSTVANAFTTDYYNAKYGTKSTDYSW